MNRDNHNISQAYLKSRLLKEGMENTYPSNWNKGFAYPIRIAGDGTEEPFLKDGKWHVRVYDAEKKQHLLYSYADDAFYPEKNEEDAEAFAGPQTGEYKISYRMRQGNDAAAIVPFEKLANTIKAFLDRNLIITGISIFVKE